MLIRLYRWLPAALMVAPLAFIAAAACGGSGNGASLFPAAEPDAGPPAPQYDGGSLFPVPDANVDAAIACTPAVLGASFAPVWKKPATSDAGACTATQTEAFYEDCLAAPVTSSQCTTFIATNGACAACLQSDDTDAEYGPVIWHSSRAFYTLNTAGCIADQQADVSPTSCGAAYQAVVQCEETACTACGVADYARFPSCEKAASTECSSYLTTLDSACGADLRDASAPAALCTSATDTKDAYLAIAPVFCGQ
jgi:hypothetical protein